MSIVEQISHPLINAISWGVIHALWQFIVIMLLHGLVMRLTARSPANVRHHLSLLALVALPLTFAITCMRQFAVYRQAKMIVSLEFNDFTRAAASGGEASLFLVEKNIPAFLQHIDSYAPWVFGLYMGGLVLFSMNAIFSYRRVSLLGKRGLQPTPAAWQQKFKILIHKTGLHRVPVYISTRVDVPMVAGFIKPVVLLPISMFSALSPDQIETIILHELRHIKNRDHYINMLQGLIEILFFFHPATWIISRRLRAERENRIDEWVVGESSAPLSYAQALMHLEYNRSQSLQPVLAATQSKNHLLTRIKNIMTMKTTSFNPGKNLAALFAILATALALVWYDPAHGLGYYNMDEPGQHVFLDSHAFHASNALALATPEDPVQVPDQVAATKEPSKVYFHDGSSINWDNLPEKDRKEIHKALQDARLALEQVNLEVLETFQSEEFSQQMHQVQEEIRKAMAELQQELHEQYHSEAFHQEMKQAQDDMRRAMEKVNKEVIEKFNSEEFREEMRMAGDEIREVIKKLEEVDWEAFGKEMNQVMKELDHTMEQIGPLINETIRELKLDEIMKEVMEALEKATEPVKENP